MTSKAIDQAPVPNLAIAGSACFNCYRSGADALGPLKRCGGCKRVRYCSTECSKAAWRDHKPFCVALSAVRARSHALLPPLYPSAPSATADELETLSNRRGTHRAQWITEDELLAVALDREPTMLESQLLWKEPRCRVCGDREADVEARESDARGWTTCHTCRLAHWCSQEHAKLGKEAHEDAKSSDGKTQCQLFRLTAEIDELFLRHALATSSGNDNGPAPPPRLWVPDRILTSPESLPVNWESYLATVTLPSPTPPTAQIYGVWLEALSPVLTLLAGMRRFDATATDLAGQIHVRLVQQTHSSVSKWLPALEEFQHQLPALRQLDLVALAPTPVDSTKVTTTTTTTMTAAPRATPLPCCPSCTSSSRSRSITELAGRPAPAPPGPLASPVSTSIALALNLSFSQSYEWDQVMWRSCVFEPCARDGTPLIFTALTQDEADEDLSALREVIERDADMNMDVVWSVEANAFCGGWPKLDPLSRGWQLDFQAVEASVTREQGWWFGVVLQKREKK